MRPRDAQLRASSDGHLLKNDHDVVSRSGARDQNGKLNSKRSRDAQPRASSEGHLVKNDHDSDDGKLNSKHSV